jgi:glucosylglycerate phosphorylase
VGLGRGALLYSLAPDNKTLDADPRMCVWRFVPWAGSKGGGTPQEAPLGASLCQDRGEWVRNERSQLRGYLNDLYGMQGDSVYDRLESLSGRYRTRLAARRAGELSQRDAILITYGDQVSEEGVAPLRTLADFCARHLRGRVSGLHILPFYPYSSDDGFSVIDYRAVNPRLGTWDDIQRLNRPFRLMFDAVINHVSQQSAWFQAFLRDDPHYRDYFIVVEDDPDLSQVVRPRALPLLTEVMTASGLKKVWTTFSEDQLDLNYANPNVLLEIVDVLLDYVARGAEIIRLDAIAYLWKDPGTACVHLPQSHRVIQILRAVLDDIAPYVKLITETNVPHKDNISYFGDGRNEAQLVYNFALPPLVLHALQTGSARVLSDWADGLTLPSDRVTFFNFLASHDGIGLNAARGILSEPEIDALVVNAQTHGGYVSFKASADGSQSPYELNINYFDALSDPKGDEPLAVQVARFMVAQSILLSVVGLPGIYFHSLFGSRGWSEGVEKTGRLRTVNRQKLSYHDVQQALANPASLRRQVFTRFARMLEARSAMPAFDPYGRQEVLRCGDSIFALLRRGRGDTAPVLCLHNVSERVQMVRVDAPAMTGSSLSRARDLLTAEPLVIGPRGALALQPYQALWLAAE